VYSFYCIACGALRPGACAATCECTWLPPRPACGGTAVTRKTVSTLAPWLTPRARLVTPQTRRRASPDTSHGSLTAVTAHTQKPASLVGCGGFALLAPSALGPHHPHPLAVRLTPVSRLPLLLACSAGSRRASPGAAASHLYSRRCCQPPAVGPLAARTASGTSGCERSSHLERAALP